MSTPFQNNCQHRDHHIMSWISNKKKKLAPRSPETHEHVFKSTHLLPKKKIKSTHQTPLMYKSIHQLWFKEPFCRIHWSPHKDGHVGNSTLQACTGTHIHIYIYKGAIQWARALELLAHWAVEPRPRSVFEIWVGPIYLSSLGPTDDLIIFIRGRQV